MCLFTWVLLVCLLAAVSIVDAEDESLSFIRIGRGVIEYAEWHPGGDYILVSTLTCAWFYTPDLQDFAHFPDVRLAIISPDGRYIIGTPDGSNIQLWISLLLKSHAHELTA